MKKMTRRSLRPALVVTFAAVAAACGSSDSGNDTTDASTICPPVCNPPADAAFDTRGDVTNGDSNVTDGNLDVTSGDTAPGSGPTIGGCPVFPADNPWNRDVSGDPVDPSSDSYIANMNPTKNLHPDWGASGVGGIPYVVVPSTQPKVPITFGAPDESDPGPYPIPADAPIEGGSDAHVLVVQQGACMLFEMFASSKDASGPGWSCGSGAVFDLNSNKLRPDGWTSADAAGLPIFPGLARADEAIDRKEIKHALRFTMVHTQKAYLHPATHYASSLTDPTLPPMGLRVRLKASFDISSFNPTTQVILTALQKYGMFVADNGSDWFITGSSDDKWNSTVMDALVNDLHNVHGSDFEVVMLGTIVKG